MSRSDRSRQGSERTAEERERDRQEREARRAGRAGSAPLEPAPHATQPELHEPPEPIDFEPELPAYDIAPAEEIQPLEEQTRIESHPSQEEPPMLDNSAAPVTEEVTEGDLQPEQEPVALAPMPARAATALQPPPPLPPELGGPRKPTPAGRRGKRSLPARLAAVLALLIVIVAVILLVRSLTHTTKHNSAIAPAPVVKVLIPEGKTRMQIAEIAASAHLKGSYRRASESSPLLSPTQFGAPHGRPDLEGFLFPATYDLDPGAPVSRLVQEQLIAFREHFGAADAARAHALHVTPYQLLIVASMVEREAQVPADRAKIAAVIYNRLREGMPLGIDAAIYYAVELQKGISTYTQELTESQLHIDSPYNTRTHTGLPPTPISNPGEASIEAAAHPAHAGYLYYVAGADGCGEQVFSDTQAEFEANVAKYEAAKQKNGGHPPTCKHK